jgi:hypothetical protein
LHHFSLPAISRRQNQHIQFRKKSHWVHEVKLKDRWNAVVHNREQTAGVKICPLIMSSSLTDGNNITAAAMAVIKSCVVKMIVGNLLVASIVVANLGKGYSSFITRYRRVKACHTTILKCLRKKRKRL